MRIGRRKRFCGLVAHLRRLFDKGLVCGAGGKEVVKRLHCCCGEAKRLGAEVAEVVESGRVFGVCVVRREKAREREVVAAQGRLNQRHRVQHPCRSGAFAVLKDEVEELVGLGEIVGGASLAQFYCECFGGVQVAWSEAQDVAERRYRSGDVAGQCLCYA